VLLLTALQGGTNLEALASAFLDRCQELEDAAHPMLAQRSIELAVDTSLDRIGAIVGIARGGRDDDAYRLRIRAEIAILNSDGTEEAITTVVQLLLGQVTKDVSFDESFPKAITVRARNVVGVTYDTDMDILVALMRRAVSAGTELDFVYSLTQADDSNIFHFSTSPDLTLHSRSYGTENGSLCGGAI